MPSAEITDIRVRKTLEAIHDSFVAMLKDLPYEKITVKALCEKARINKKTFYRYYPTLDDLLMELQTEYAMPYIEQTKGMRYPDDVEQITRYWLRYSAAQGELYDRIVSSSAYGRILDKVIQQMESDRYRNSAPPEGWSKEQWSLYMTYVTSAQLRFYRQWVEDGRVLPEDEMVELACRLICNGAAI